jgi:hypothetical protein
MLLSDTTKKDGLLQDIEFWCNFPDGTLTTDSTLFFRFLGLLNHAFDEVLPLIFTADQKWQWDDSNHTDFPIATTNLVSGQSDYSFVADENGNSILEIQEVYVMDAEGKYQKLTPIDASTGNSQVFAEDDDNTGMPLRYDKFATSIILDPIPDASRDDGIRVVFARTQQYFEADAVDDFVATQTPGIPKPFHRLLSLKAAHDWLSVNKSENGTLLTRIEAKAATMGANLTLHIGKRSRDEKTVVRTRPQSSR